MRLEYHMKHSATHALISYYEDDVLNVMLKFFNQKRRRKRYMRNDKCIIDDILNNSNFDDKKKFSLLVNTLYLSDILTLTLQTDQFKKIEILNNYYSKIPDDIHDLDKNKSDLINLRNCIAHYNFSLYDKNKMKYLETLYIYEVHLGHNILGIDRLPKFKNKPNTKNILKEINKYRPDLLQSLGKMKNSSIDKDRELLSIFDDIAIYNGYDTSELPSPWTILRQMFLLKKEIQAEKNLMKNC